MKNKKSYKIEVDGVTYPSIKKASKEIGVRSVSLYLKAREFISKGFAFDKEINGRNFRIDQKYIKPSTGVVHIEEPQRDPLAKVILAKVDCSGRYRLERDIVVENDILSNSGLTLEEQKNVTFEIIEEEEEYDIEKYFKEDASDDEEREVFRKEQFLYKSVMKKTRKREFLIASIDASVLRNARYL